MGYLELLQRKYPELNKDERMKKRIINDIPILIGSAGEIICIPNKKEIPSPIGFVGKKGCLSGDTLIRINRHKLGRKYRLDYLYSQFHNQKDLRKKWNLKSDSYIRAFNGELIKLHKIKDVVYSGKKEIFKIILEDGKSIKATSNHLFMTSRGWVPVNFLKEEVDKVMCDTPNSKKKVTNRLTKDYDFLISNLKYHPYLNKGKRLEIHRATYEAHINKLSLREYIKILSNFEDEIKNLEFVNPDFCVIHHIDGNHYNNEISNLKLMDKIEHLKLHGEKMYSNFNQGVPEFVKIIKIESYGVEDTYDVICEEPFHNFSANDIIVHNSGKSLGVETIATFAFWLWGVNVTHLNDSMEECYDWVFGQNNKRWLMLLESIDCSPLPLPCVFLYHMNKDLDLPEEYIESEKRFRIIGKRINYAKIAIPLNELLENINEYMENLKGSDPYFRNIIDKLKVCKNLGEIEEVISEIKVGEATTSVQNKILSNLNAIFREKIVDIATEGEAISQISIVSKKKEYEYKGNPFIALMKLGVVPIFITSNLYIQRYKNHIYAHHINQLYDAQEKVFKKPDGSYQRTYILFDELTKVCSTEDKKKNLAEEALNNVAARGRLKGIGIVYATQNYGKIPHIIKSQTEYLFVLKHSSRAEIDEIEKNFGVEGLRDEVINLKKEGGMLECIGLTSEYFNVYTKDGGFYQTKNPVRGVIFPPMSRHKYPG